MFTPGLEFAVCAAWALAAFAAAAFLVTRGDA
jgi:hypothetical protein